MSSGWSCSGARSGLLGRQLVEFIESMCRKLAATCTYTWAANACNSLCALNHKRTDAAPMPRSAQSGPNFEQNRKYNEGVSRGNGQWRIAMHVCRGSALSCYHTNPKLSCSAASRGCWTDCNCRAIFLVDIDISVSHHQERNRSRLSAQTFTMRVSVSGSDSDLEVVGECSAEQNRHQLCLPASLAHLAANMESCRLPCATLHSSRVSHQALARPSLLTGKSGTKDKQALRATFNRARKDPHAKVAEHGGIAVDGTGLLTLEDDRWLQVGDCSRY